MLTVRRPQSLTMMSSSHRREIRYVLSLSDGVLCSQLILHVMCKTNKQKKLGSVRSLSFLRLCWLYLYMFSVQVLNKTQCIYFVSTLLLSFLGRPKISSVTTHCPLLANILNCRFFTESLFCHLLSGHCLASFSVTASELKCHLDSNLIMSLHSHTDTVCLLQIQKESRLKEAKENGSPVSAHKYIHSCTEM